MAGNPIKFRCYQCNQLLGVSRNRVGGVVSCPKCQAGLIVPDPEEGATTSLNIKTDEPATGTLDAGLPLDLIDIRPEDIRVEPGADWVRSPQSSSESRTATLARVIEEPALEEEPEQPPHPAPSSVTSTEPATTSTRSPVSIPTDEGAILPPLDIEPTSRNSHRRIASTRSRDIILPRSTVAAWSLFVLVAQGLAFVAGLLAGHFLWKVH